MTEPIAVSKPSEAPAPTIVRMERVSKSFGQLKVLDSVDLEIKKGEVCVFIGPSGSGKTTLLRCVNNLTMIDSGRIEVHGHLIADMKDGQSISHVPDREIRRHRAEIGFVFQHFNLFPHLNVLDNITLALRRVRGIRRAEANQRARDLLTWVSLADKERVLPGHLSGGQKQRVAIARSLAMNPALMLFDEATSALDPERVGEVLQVIGRLAAQGMTMMMVTHEMEFARRVANRIIFMEGGRIVEQGPPSQVLDAPKHERTAAFLRPATYGLGGDENR